MMRLDLSEFSLTYLLKRSSARRSLALKVNAAGLAQVNAPLAMAQYRIDAFLVRHADWLLLQLSRNATPFSWRGGIKLPYLGGELVLSFASASSQEPVWRQDDRLVCGGAVPESAVVAWYRNEARRILAERLRQVCAERGLVEPPWRLSSARTRWGSLSPKGVVSLNWRLIKASPAGIDYVICHELAHFRHRDHSSAFWREVARLYPDYEAAQTEFRDRGREFMMF